MRRCFCPRGCTLVEILVVLTFLPLLLLLFLTLFSQLQSWQIRLEEEKLALSRSLAAFALLEEPLESCGYAIPSESSNFKTAFLFLASAPYNWGTPVSVQNATDSTGKIRLSAVCRILYATPSGVRTKTSISVGETPTPIELTGDPGLIEPNTTYSYTTKNWALFAASQEQAFPLLVTHKSGALLRAQAPAGHSLQVVQNDELYYLRAMEVLIEDGVLVTKDFLGSGLQSRIRGIVDMRFEWDATSKLLTLHILSKGDRTINSDSRLPDNWPEQYSSDIKEEVRHYALCARSITVHLKNIR